MKNRKHTRAKVVALLLVVLVLDLVTVKAANAYPARTPEAHAQKIARVARTIPVGSQWEGVLNSYTGGSYGVDRVNSLWPLAPRGKRRRTVLGAAIHHHVPFRLLLGVWGAESGFGRYACFFGLTGYFPGTGTSGDFWKDAHLAADLFDRLYRAQYGHRAF